MIFPGRPPDIVICFTKGKFRDQTQKRLCSSFLLSLFARFARRPRFTFIRHIVSHYRHSRGPALLRVATFRPGGRRTQEFSVASLMPLGLRSREKMTTIAFGIMSSGPSQATERIIISI